MKEEQKFTAKIWNYSISKSQGKWNHPKCWPSKVKGPPEMWGRPRRRKNTEKMKGVDLPGCATTILGGEGNVTHQPQSKFSLHCTSEIPSNNIEKSLGFIAHNLFLFCNICSYGFTTIPHILQKIKHRDKERKKKILG